MGVDRRALSRVVDRREFERRRNAVEGAEAMSDDFSDKGRGHERWAHLRFAIIGPLLAAPPMKGELGAALEALADKEWRHPRSGEVVRFGFSTIERWYYQARKAEMDPVGVLRRRVRRDLGQSRLAERVRQTLVEQWHSHKRWSYQLHADNLAARIEKDPSLGPAPSYWTVKRYMQAKGLLRRPRLGPAGRPGVERAERRLEEREVRSYEAEYVHGLWHADFHHGSLKVPTAGGEWQRPLLLGVLDDRSRLCCHAQWYLAETAENFVHGLSQAFQKRGLPRALMTDNGSPMVAAETVAGLRRLGIVPELTLAASPYQNGKQEVFWARVEGRLLAMLEGVEELDLARLNEATLAWVEMEYNREVHRETGEAPIRRFLEGPDVGRPCPSSEALRAAFTMAERRTQRRSDGTVTVEGIRYEVPSRYRALTRVTVRYARWDLSFVRLIDERADVVLARLYPLDKTKNAEGVRRPHVALVDAEREVALRPRGPGIAPLLEKLMAQYAATGLPPAYVPKDEVAVTKEEDVE